MKKFIFFLIVLVSTRVSFSQITKGSMLLGGNVSFQSYKGETQMGISKVRTFDVAPNIGYFLVDQLAIGLRPGFTLSSSDVPSATLKSTTFTLAPFVRYYFLERDKKINVFADAAYGYSKTDYSEQPYFDDYSSSTYTIMAGPCIFLHPTVSLEFTVGYKSYNDRYNSTNGSTIFTQLGFQIHFDAHKAK